MIQYQDTDADERREIFDKAWTFRHDHADHVANLIKHTEVAVAPSGSDLFKPELWKAIHWNWFIKNMTPPPSPEESER